MTLFVGVYKFSTIFVKHTKDRGFRLRRNWARLGTKILGIKIQREGEAINEPALYVVNHRSLVDPMIIAPYLNAFVVAKAEIANYPVLGPGAEQTGIVFVKREEKSSRSATIDAIEMILKRGDNVMIFPEGTTNLYQFTKEYKLGSFRVAAELNIPVVPVVLEYRDHKDLWNIHKMVPQFLKQFGSLRTYTKMKIGKPIYNGDPKQLMQEAKDYTDMTLNEMHANWSTMKFTSPEDEEDIKGS
ncbi:1-acyl-sn-glycerol-3-phosphate acyltransferase [Saprospiraceae bacterium]|nr:1-acyl-sn-glycerol-3-phosphate acyltransferase [Saprospiraceae bacterium]